MVDSEYRLQIRVDTVSIALRKIHRSSKQEVRLIPLIPWWLLAKILRLEQFDRDYDWSLKGLMRTPVRRSAIVLGWAFWIVLIFGFLILLFNWSANSFRF